MSRERQNEGRLSFNFFEESPPFPKPIEPNFSFIDLFAGIGGFRLAMQSLGGDCVFSSEWNIPAAKTYEANFGEYPYGDITLSETKALIPQDFDILCAGFPCQAFSIAGKRLGFQETRGTLFFDVAEILSKHKPKAFILENVKGLVTHAKGQTLDTILNVLRDDLGYVVPIPRILNATDFGVPQHRERIIIVGFRPDIVGASLFCYPQPDKETPRLASIIEENEVSVKYYLSTQYIETLRKHKERHSSKGNGFGYQILSLDGVANALVCGGMGRERNLIIDNRLSKFTPITRIKGEVNREGIRKMTPREWARLQGFPDEYKIISSDASAYAQFGNSVAIPMIRAVAKQIIKVLNYDWEQRRVERGLRTV